MERTLNEYNKMEELGLVLGDHCKYELFQLLPLGRDIWKMAAEMVCARVHLLCYILQQVRCVELRYNFLGGIFIWIKALFGKLSIL